MAVSLFTVVMGALFGMALSLNDTAGIQDIKATSNDEARRAFQAIIPELCQAARSSINWNDLPGGSITYRTATDLDGNGSAVDVGGRLELSAPKTIQRDVDDLNGDGRTLDQLVLINGNNVQVLANNLVPQPESPDESGAFGSEQDTNGNGQLDRGFWAEPRNGGLMVSVHTQGMSRQQHILVTRFEEFVVPRN